MPVVSGNAALLVMELETLVTINIILQERLEYVKRRNRYLESLIAELVMENAELHGLVETGQDLLAIAFEDTAVPALGGHHA